MISCSHATVRVSGHRFSYGLVCEVLETRDLSIVLDRELHYVLVNQAASEQLGRKPSSLLGRSILELYPQLTASRNHRNFLRALGGETIHDVVESVKGGHFQATYRPVFEEERIGAIVVRAVRLGAWR